MFATDTFQMRAILVPKTSRRICPAAVVRLLAVRT